MIMTSNKSQKTDIRQRMSETGEPYSVARHAVLAATGDDDHDTMLAEPAAPTSEGPHAPSESRLEHEASPRQHDDSPEEQYLRDAEAAGLPADELIELRAQFHVRKLAEDMRRATDGARARADLAEEAAERAEERADLAQEAADLAQDWDSPEEQKIAQARADVMREAADVARERAERAEETAGKAEEAADKAEEAASESDDAASEYRDYGWRDYGDNRPHEWHSRSGPGMPRRPPRLPQPPRLPRLPKLPKLPRLPDRRA
jgi:hypothetical protein